MNPPRRLPPVSLGEAQLLLSDGAADAFTNQVAVPEGRSAVAIAPNSVETAAQEALSGSRPHSGSSHQKRQRSGKSSHHDERERPAGVPTLALERVQFGKPV